MPIEKSREVISGPSRQNRVQQHSPASPLPPLSSKRHIKDFSYVDIIEITALAHDDRNLLLLYTETFALWYSYSACDLWVGSVALQRLNAAHAAQMTFSTQASKDNVGYSSSISRCQCSLTQDAAAPGFLWHLTQVSWSVIIDLEAQRSRFTVVNRVHGGRLDCFVWWKIKSPEQK